jgi:predicted metalloprotease with PDZ domain
VKGPIVGFLLDAKLRRASDNRKSLDDLMRLAYQRYAGARGFAPEEFRATAEEVAGVDLKDWFRKAISSTEELDYSEALDWFGLRFAPMEPAISKRSDHEARKAAPEASNKTSEVSSGAIAEVSARKAACAPAGKWELEVREDSTEPQREHLRGLFRSGSSR